MTELDVEQVLELMVNGFSRIGACILVAEAHDQGGDYVEALLADQRVQDQLEEP